MNKNEIHKQIQLADKETERLQALQLQVAIDLETVQARPAKWREIGVGAGLASQLRTDRIAASPEVAKGCYVCGRLSKGRGLKRVAHDDGSSMVRVLACNECTSECTRCHIKRLCIDLSEGFRGQKFRDYCLRCDPFD